MAIQFELEDRVAWITLDRPEALNAIDPETHAELVAAWKRVQREDGIRVSVVTGAGPKAFCAGVDLKRMGDFYTSVPPEQRVEVWNREPGIGGITRNLEVSKPILAAINGLCLGGGLELALACDIRLASENATFGLPEVRWAIIPGQGGTQRLPRTIPPSVALEMILTGESIDADRALAVGLVNHVYPAARLREETRALAEKIAAHPARTVRHALEAVRRGLTVPLAEGLKIEQALADPLRDAPENREARAAFREKRRPNWNAEASGGT
ncbi:MAG TPA: enoyl-CoA hydratase/isomerase family protein [Thermoplasmata archaeon]|nr:enoyl-CoA hydratase/isomerase family protein [Thermoplasmata archaeon]